MLSGHGCPPYGLFGAGLLRTGLLRTGLLGTGRLAPRFFTPGLLAPGRLASRLLRRRIRRSPRTALDAAHGEVAHDAVGYPQHAGDLVERLGRSVEGEQVVRAVGLVVD